MAPPSATTTFLSLPVELRDAVYGYSVVNYHKAVDPLRVPYASATDRPTPLSNLAGLQLISNDGRPETAVIAVEATEYFYKYDIIIVSEVELPQTLPCNANIRFDPYLFIRRSELLMHSRRRGSFLSQWGYPSPATKFEITFRMPALRELRITSVFALAGCLFEDRADQVEIRAFIAKLEASGVTVVKDFESIPAP